MSNIGVIHEDVAGFGDGLGFQALNEDDSAKIQKEYKSFEVLNEEKKGEVTKDK